MNRNTTLSDGDHAYEQCYDKKNIDYKHCYKWFHCKGYNSTCQAAEYEDRAIILTGSHSDLCSADLTDKDGIDVIYF